ncbi:MAG: beta-N-acetylhexosaminidase, partial [Crocinitomicaceae bacterium]|nr:beta-N-acetylhexosaminidase [Crocinitomicaceae bacterium]
MKKIGFVFVFIFVSSYVASQIEECPVLPSPLSYQVGEGETVIEGELLVNTEGINFELISFLKNQLLLNGGIKLKEDNSSSAIHFSKIKNVSTDFYSITFQSQNKTIQYSSQASLFYALNSLLQLVEVTDDFVRVKHCFLQDAPKFQWRGLHLDVSRHFYSVEEVKHFIDLMALYKFNKFHWHLTDDQGWRIEIKQYPKLAEIGGYRDSTIVGHYSRTPRTYNIEKYGGFYTQEEAKEVVDYAKTKFIEVVPEIELPGHSRAALAAYPELSCTGEQNPVPGLWGVFDDIYCAKKESVDFMKNVLSEVLEIFPSEYIHIGGDEAPKTRWKSCGSCQQVIKENDLKDEH